MTVQDAARRLPEIDALRKHCRALALLEAILSPDWAYRNHSFDAHWSRTEAMASMRNGSGDEWAIVFSPAGAWIRGFAHESPMSPYEEDGPWPGVLDDVPEVFAAYVEEPAFTDEDGLPVVTACLWRRATDDGWSTGTIDFPEHPTDDPDGAGHLFRLLTDRSAQALRAWAEDYYEVPVDLEAVRHVLASRPLTDAVVRALNPELTVADLAKDLEETGYPQA
ncbi:hypothetical protein [Streptomyces aurantiogriseus]|uniref:Uncharacterized protein n=1 Tax=Streptomyces aurantiogriseus TaxID=66870 RepID=A0A918C8L3_9ACTN|nr:hypothetical protein [Streptomyces aurantiogriseus]GGR12168.1 hypothetical protein GCM10010251_30460 [Streptomyces aurantiogriseus]